MAQEAQHSQGPDRPEENVHIDALWQQYREEPTLETKNELLVHYLYLVKSIVRRMMPTYHGHNDYDDLVSCGVIGLMDAIDKFDLGKNVKFETYAAKRIRGEIIDSMRKQDWAPSSLRRKINKISQAFEVLEGNLGRAPKEIEVAQYLNMNESELSGALEKSHIFNLLYFEDFLTESYAGSDMVQMEEYTPPAQVEKKELKEILADMIDSLPEKERLVITLYYYEELTLKEIAAILGVTESRISQIHSKVLMKLRTKMQEEFA